jgi:hypothetical protein
VVGALKPEKEGLPWELLALHPPPAKRVAALADTRPLFSIGAIGVFAAGLSATIAFDSVHSLVAWYVDDPLDVAMIAALVFAPLLVGVVGVALWRDRFGALASGTRTQPVWPLGLALAAGMLIGPELSLARAVPGTGRGLLGDLLHGDGILWAVALTALTLLLLDWIASGASVWLRAEAARRSPDAWTAGLLVAAGVLTIVLGAFYSLHTLSEGITFSKALTAQQWAQITDVAYAGPKWLWQLVMDPQTLVLIGRPLIPVAVVLLWAFPLAAALVRRRQTGEAPWAFLDPGGVLAPDRPRIGILRPVLIGVAGGVACLFAYVIHRSSVHSLVSLDTRLTDEFVLSFFFWQITIALAAQGVVGAVATGFARDRTRLVEGLLAATVAGSIATFGIVAGPVAGGCVDPISIRPGPCTWDVAGDFTWQVWRQTIVQGAVVALAGGLVVLGGAALFRGRQPDPGLRPAGARL